MWPRKQFLHPYDRLDEPVISVLLAGLVVLRQGEESALPMRCFRLGKFDLLGAISTPPSAATETILASLRSA